MVYHKFIKTKGKDGSRIGYFAPRMYQLVCNWSVLKAFGFTYIKDHLSGWTIWWFENEEDYIQAIKMLDELKKTHIFNHKMSG